MRTALLLAALFGGALAAAVPLPAEPLRISVIQRSGTQDVAGRMLKEVYARAGVAIELMPLPAARATELSRRGDVDGEAARIAAYYAERPDLVVVEPALLWTDSVVYMRRGAAKPVVGAADLAGLRVGVVRGVRQSLMASAGVERVEQVNEPRQLYLMLGSGRLDAVIDSTVSRKRYTRELGLDNVVEAGTLSRMPVFHALHRRHAARVPRIASTLAALQASGELARLEARAEREAARPESAQGAE